MARTKATARFASSQQGHRQPPMTEMARKQAHDPMGAAARSGTRTGVGPLTLEELKDLCRQRGLPVTGNKTVLLERLGGKGSGSGARPAASARPNVAGVRKPAASRASSGRFVVWHRSEWRPDGWHSYQGPGQVHMDSVHASKAAANKAVKALFYDNNPWGLGANEIKEGQDVDEEWNDGLLTLSVSPEDSETWTVGAKLAGDD